MDKIKNFFVDIYDKFISLSWVEWTINYCKENIFMASLIGGSFLFILVVLCIIGGRHGAMKKAERREKRAKKRAEKQEKYVKKHTEIAAQRAANRAPKAPKKAAISPPVKEEIAQPVAEPTVEETIEETAETPAPLAETVTENADAPVDVAEELIEIAPAEEKTEEEPIVETEETTEEEPVAEAEDTTEEEPVAEAEDTTEDEPVAEAEDTTEDEPVAETEETTEEEPIVETEETTEDEPVAEAEDTTEEEPVAETEEEPVPVEEEKEKDQEIAATAAPAEEIYDDNRKQTKAEEVNDAFAMVEESENDDPLSSNYDEGETDRIARYKGKWVICRVLTDDESAEEMYFFELRASNGEKLLSSEEYTSYQGALRGIQTHKTNILKGNLKVGVSKKGDYLFKLLSGKNMLLCMGENYPTKARCESAVDSTIRFAATAIIDENVQDIAVKVPKEEETEEEIVTENSHGKWIVSAGLNAEGKKIFFFELYANNGEKLLESEEYTTYIGAVNGIQTHKKNVEKDNFRISLTKRGDYIYKLLNGNGQLLCLGEHYKTKRLCQNAVDSVKRFAMSSPILTEEERK